MKNYVGYVNDHSGSMAGAKARAAIQDYNTNITATKNAASREMLDTVVSVVGIGLADGSNGRGCGVKRQVVISNPHVLKPVIEWPTPGGTPLWDGIGDMITLFKSLPDYNNPDVSFLVVITTDGEEQHSSLWTKSSLASEIQTLQNSGRWTFVFRVPTGGRRYLAGLGVPYDNIQEWDNTAEGLAKSTIATTQAVDSYYAARSAGAKSSTVFYANASKVDTSALKELDPKEFSLYVVPGAPTDAPTLISDFILSKRMQYLKGAAFYQLTKTEPRVTPSKLILVRDRTTGKVYAGNEARQMIGLPVPATANARVHPGDHGNYDIFIQSESWNRHLVGGTGVIYWEKQGKPFTAEDLAKFQKPATPAAPAVVQLPPVAPTNKPTPSPVAKKPTGETVNGRPVKFFDKRDEAREYARVNKLPKGSVGDQWSLPTPHTVIGHNGKRWFVYL
jgi:hypothetical protein